MKHGTSAPAATRGTFTLERACHAPLGRLWGLWTTASGLKRWWGPAGFCTRVLTLDVWPGGEWHLILTARAPALIGSLRATGEPLTKRLRATYTQVLPPRRLRYTSAVSAVSGVAPYEVAVLIELHAAGEEALIVVTADALHEPELTERSQVEWVDRLGRLGSQLA